jgi:hypothetical protein
VTSSKFRYEVFVEVLFEQKDIDLLLLCASHHYDGTCRMAGENGFLRGIANRAKWRAESKVPDEHPEEIMGFRDIDTMCKILEGCRYEDPKYHDLGADLAWRFKNYLKDINAEVRRLHPWLYKNL